MSTMMSLKNAAGNYLVVESIDINNGAVFVSFYQDKNHKTNGDTEYLKARHDVFTIRNMKDYIEFTPSADGSIMDNAKAICYNELLNMPEFSDWTQEIKAEKVKVVSDIRDKIAAKKAAKAE